MSKVEVLTKFQNQLQEMVNHFNKEQKSKSIAENLDEIRAKISRKIGSLEGWFIGETEF